MAKNTFTARGTAPRRGRRRVAMLLAGVTMVAGGVWLSLGGSADTADPDPVASTAATMAEGERRSVSLTLPGQSRAAPPPERQDTRSEAAEPAAPVRTRLEPTAVEAAAAPAPEAPGSQDESAGAGGADAAADLAASAQQVRRAAEAFELTLGELAARPEAPGLPGEWQPFEVRSGDSLAALFDRASLGPRDVHEVVNAGGRAEELVRLFPGDVVELRLDDDGTLHGVRYELSETETLLLTRTAGDGYEPQVKTRELERRVAHAQGRVSTSLYAAGLEAGLDDRLIMELAAIFGWDVDFALDLRRDDSFVVIYEELYRDGEKLGNGRILAAEFINRGERFRAVRYTDPSGDSDYYAPDGRSMRKAFLRTPADFTRVSSNFNPNRLHPIHGTRRPHMGTDYAAAPGTPIKAAGDGKIIHRGRKGGYGNTVIIQHGTRYTTLYAHMRGYRRGLSVGDRVQQGDIIGYVGSTGLSTGPHLHYEFRVDGTHRNPRTVDLPEARPIAAEYRDEFKAESRAYLARLDTLSRTLLARIETDQSVP